jgi:opacity protein-like surface antigen
MAQVSPTVEEQRALEAERQQDAARAAEAERNRTTAQATEAERQRELERTDRRYDDYYYEERYRRSEFYVAGFGGYTFGHGFDAVQGTGAASGTNFGNFDLKDSGVYGIKAGYFLPRRLNWLGFEVEGFNTTPHIKETALTPGSHLRVTTLAFNAIARAKTMCERHDDHHGRITRRTSDPDDRTTRRATDPDYRDFPDHEFCRLQPYMGVGIGVFFANASNSFGSDTDNAAPGFNGLAGIRYYFTERIALFGEYKYTRATFNFDNIAAGNAGFRGDYSASHVVGGLSLHF